MGDVAEIVVNRAPLLTTSVFGSFPVVMPIPQPYRSGGLALDGGRSAIFLHVSVSTE
jgi:hypothetical protein